MAPNPPPTPPRQPNLLTITITGHARTHGEITLSFVATPVAASDSRPARLTDQAAGATVITYTATCSATTAATSSASGTTSPLTLSGVDDSTTYSCIIAAVRDGIPLGTSNAVILDPIPAGELPATGTDALSLASAAAAATAAGLLLVLAAAHERRRPRPKH